MKKDNDDFEAEFEKRIREASNPFICPFCGKQECTNLWHILKLSTLPRWRLRPKHFVMIYAMFFGFILLVSLAYVGIMFFLKMGH